jgi:hypothetical protein
MRKMEGEEIEGKERHRQIVPWLCGTFATSRADGQNLVSAQRTALMGKADESLKCGATKIQGLPKCLQNGGMHKR